MIRFVLPLALLAVATGCMKGKSNPAGLPAGELKKLRAELLLADEPESPQTVIEVRDTLASGEAAEAVAVVGRIGGMPNPYDATSQPGFPWAEGQAVFFLVDPSTAAEFKGHQHAEGEECMFCAGKAKQLVDTVAMVQLNVAGTGVPPVRADKLLDLKEGVTVVVEGNAKRALGMLVIEATGVFVRPEVAEGVAANKVP